LFSQISFFEIFLSLVLFKLKMKGRKQSQSLEVDMQGTIEKR
jgi:hypothetical protein